MIENIRNEGCMSNELNEYCSRNIVASEWLKENETHKNSNY